MKNYYKILEVDPMASHEEIRDAYRKAVKKYHPDVSQVSNSEAMIREINEAYEILSDETSRQQYDNELKYTITGGQAPTKQRTSEGSYKKKGKRSRRNFSDITSTANIVIVFLILVMIGVIGMLVQTVYLESISDNNSSLHIGMSSKQVEDIYGQPDSISETQINYDSAAVLLKGGVVVGWYDAYNVFNIKNEDIKNISDIKIGEEISSVIADYGSPDTYAKTFIVYGYVIINYDENDHVTKVSTLG